ncbi:MAG: M23 family metallopeptidase [Polyangiaceae bacterium]|nr:M23 family metallopeptidase [Polyangiaceae bacterium]
MSNKPSWRCEPERDCYAADVAKTEPGSDLKNTLILPRRLRVRVLDCRSGEPVVGHAVQEVRLNGEPLAKLLAADREWDVSKHFPISGSGAQRKFGDTSVTLTKASQIALNALGYDCGAPGNAYGNQGKTAFLKFRVVAQDVAFKAEDLRRIDLFGVSTLAQEFLPAAGKKTLRQVTDADGKEVELRAPTDAEADELVRIYNTKCYRAAQFHLATLDFYPRDDAKLADGVMDAPDSGEWTEAWQTAFKAWQKVTFGSATSAWVKTAKQGAALMTAQRGFVTNAAGDVFIPIPLSALEQRAEVEIGFKDFAVVAEATLAEHEADGVKLHRVVQRSVGDDGALGPMQPKTGATLFSVEWVDGQQSAEWDKPWGWRCGNDRSTSDSERSSFKELRTSWKFEIPPFTQEELSDPAKSADWSTLHGRTKALSMFHGPDQPEFVLFALIWCQPVWDEFDDPRPRTSAVVGGNNATYAWPGAPPEYMGIHMHVVTQYYDLGGTDPYGGKGYGLYEHDVPGPTRWRGGDGHHGMDIHARVGDNLFAVHAGRMTYTAGAGEIGNIVRVSWTPLVAERSSIGYGHVTDKVGDAPRQVRAGEIVAKAGRTGNLKPASDQAGHVHLNIGATANDLHGSPSPANRVCIPFNERTPHVLPCRCDVKHKAAELQGCNFEHLTVTFKSQEVEGGNMVVPQTCWAVGELACPHMPRPGGGDLADLSSAGASRIKRRVQAQLRYLLNRGTITWTGIGTTNTAYALTLDGDLGAYPKEAKVKTQTANLRGTASTQGAVLGQAKKDDVLPLVRTEGEWCYVTLPAAIQATAGQTEGWVHSSLVKVATVGRTRRAIRAFKDHYGLLPAEPAMKDLYELDQAALDKLDEVAPLAPIE